MRTKTEWKKIPSVTRPGRYFYRSGKVTVRQSFMTGDWSYQREGSIEVGGFKTPDEAKAAADLMAQ
jgi:hypothetical protein